MKPLVAALTILLAAWTVWAGSTDTRPKPSPRTLVQPQSCGAKAPCPEGYWVFRAPDCEYHGALHPPGTVLRFEDKTTLQCRCRLPWVLTKQGEPPTAKVSCAWVDLGEAGEEH